MCYHTDGPLKMYGKFGRWIALLILWMCYMEKKIELPCYSDNLGLKQHGITFVTIAEKFESSLYFKHIHCCVLFMISLLHVTLSCVITIGIN